MNAQFYTLSDAQVAEIEKLVTRLMALTFETTPAKFKKLPGETQDANVLASMFYACVHALSHRPGGIKNEAIINGYALAVGKLMAAELPPMTWPICLGMFEAQALATAEQVETITTPPTATRQ